jgi:hypothetical protein
MRHYQLLNAAASYKLHSVMGKDEESYFDSTADRMNFNLILVIITSFGACVASPFEGITHNRKFVEWSTTVVPYKFDQRARFNHHAVRSIREHFRIVGEELSVQFNKLDNESFYLLITSTDQCVEEKLRASNYGHHAILVCIDDDDGVDLSAEIRRAAKMGFKINAKMTEIKD